MKLHFLLVLPITVLLFPSIALPDGFQPFEAGAYPITSRIETIKKIISAIELRLSNSDLSPDERELRNNCLIEYSNEKKLLEFEYQEAKRITRLPGVTYLERQAESNCLQGLTIPSGVQPATEIKR